MPESKIKDKYCSIRKTIPSSVDIVVAAKTQKAKSIREVIEAGAEIIGENYLQETQSVLSQLQDLAKKVNWHMIGHLQINKVKKAVEIFNMIETVDSLKLAKEIDKRCKEINKMMPILIEVNIAKENQKSGVLAEDCLGLIKEIYNFSNVKIMGLMTMGPLFGNPEKLRIYFKKTKDIFNRIKELNLSGVDMKYLSMGMSHTYQVAIEEGSNIVRIGEVIFGKRKHEYTQN